MILAVFAVAAALIRSCPEAVFGAKNSAPRGRCLEFIIWKLLQHGGKVGKMALYKGFRVFDLTLDSIKKKW